MVSLFKNSLFLKKLNNNWIFEYVIALSFMAIGLIGWKWSYSVGCFLAIVLTLLLMFIFNDFKYMIPTSIVAIFSYSAGYDAEKLPIPILFFAATIIFITILFTILNFKRSNFKKPKSYFGILLLSISCIIPIFWNQVITYQTRFMYFIYFTWLLYIVVYFIFGINLGKRSLRMAIFTLSWLPVLISAECFFGIMDAKAEYPNEFLLSLSYNLGWGICNEAGLIICFSLPFIFYELIKTDNSIISLLSIAKIGVSSVGILLTTSRGSYLFGVLEIILLFILMIIFSRKRITNIVFFILLVSLALLYLQLNFGIVNLIEEIIDKVFYNNLGDSGRFALWERARDLWNENTVNRIFGSGIVSEIEERNGELIFIVYHSTFFEILAVGGIIGVASLCLHFFEKYKQLWRKEIGFALTMLIGYLVLDAYGMIDNTYGMYYYMVPLIIVMASMDNDEETDIFSSNCAKV